MCGIVGVVTRDAKHPFLAPARVIRMRDTMVHRGPDDAGLHCADHVALGQRRLSIIDLSSGQQPMPSDDERLWALNNGEIYNFRELRTTLEKRGHDFRTQSDTESILYAYREYGVECVQHLRGMFALAIWDADEKRLFLARDRTGQKPLYYAITPEGIQFASELKALLIGDALPREVDPQALADYLAYKCVPAPLTIFKHIRKLPPGHAMTYNANTGDVNIWRYWGWERIADVPPDFTYEQAVEELGHHLSEATRLRLISDVPLGALLSGGIDSTAVVAMMARHSSGPVKTFTVGFEAASHDERAPARQVADHFGTDHHDMILQPEAIHAILPRLARQYDEPFADNSALPTYYVCRMARQQVTVALTGDGGDEAFAGYGRYFRLIKEARRLDRLPLKLRQMALAPALALSPDDMRGKRTLERAKLPLAERYQAWMTQFLPRDQATLVNPAWRAKPRPLIREHMQTQNAAKSFLAAMQYADMNVYLPADILVKADRASMLNSLELRAPLLDHELLNFAGTLPPDWVYGKRILKDALRGLVPEGILTRPKSGFGVPLTGWFKGSYRDYLGETLFDPGAKSRDYLRLETLKPLFRRERWSVTVSYKFWSLLMFELWAQSYL